MLLLQKPANPVKAAGSASKFKNGKLPKDRRMISYFVHFLRYAQILIFEILRVFLRLKFSHALKMNEIFCYETVFPNGLETLFTYF